MNDCIVVKLMHRVDIDATLKVTKGQGHKVKGQGQIYSYMKKLFGLYIDNEWLDLHQTYTYDRF